VAPGSLEARAAIVPHGHWFRDCHADYLVYLARLQAGVFSSMSHLVASGCRANNGFICFMCVDNKIYKEQTLIGSFARDNQQD
jgi:hypothetical protein